MKAISGESDVGEREGEEREMDREEERGISRDWRRKRRMYNVLWFCYPLLLY